MLGTAGGSDRRKHVLSLTVSLVNSGLGMLEWGDSRPASGSEHHVSHFLEMWEGRGGGETHRHGIRVGVAEVCMSSVYHHLFQQDVAAEKTWMGRRKPESASAFAARVEAAYGPAAGEILAEQGACYLDEAARRTSASRRVIFVAGAGKRAAGPASVGNAPVSLGDAGGEPLPGRARRLPHPSRKAAPVPPLHVRSARCGPPAEPARHRLRGSPAGETYLPGRHAAVE